MPPAIIADVVTRNDDVSRGGGPVRLTLLDRILGAKDRLVASRRFQRFAVSFPLTRPIARHRARALFDLCAGFVYSQVLLSCVQLRLFDLLAAGPRTAPALAAELSLPLDATTRLLTAAVSLGLVSRRGVDRYALGRLGAALTGNPGVVAMIEHHAMLYGDLRDPVALLRGAHGQGEIAEYWAYSNSAAPRELSDKDVAPYSALMAASQTLMADDILDSYDFARHRSLLDVGGGAGAFAIAAARRVKRLTVAAFDLPPVAEIARRRFAEAGLDSRATAFGGDFLVDELPRGADIVTLVRVLHDHDDGVVLAILRAIRKILPPDGVLLIAEPMSGTRGGEPIADAYFGFYLLAMGHGRARTDAALEAMLHETGFGRVGRLKTKTPMFCRVLIVKPR